MWFYIWIKLGYRKARIAWLSCGPVVDRRVNADRSFGPDCVGVGRGCLPISGSADSPRLRGVARSKVVHIYTLHSVWCGCSGVGCGNLPARRRRDVLLRLPTYMRPIHRGGQNNVNHTGRTVGYRMDMAYLWWWVASRGSLLKPRGSSRLEPS